MEHLIEELKENICAAVDDIDLETEMNENLEVALEDVENLLKLAKKAQKIFDDWEGNTDFDVPKEKLITFKEETTKTYEKLKRIKRARNGSKKGKKRIYFAVSIEILKAIDVSEHHNIDLKWIKKFLDANGELSQYLKEYGRAKKPIQLPVPTNEYDDSKWLYKLKETLQRSLFSAEEDKVKKKTDSSFEQKRTQFYKDLRQNYDLYSLGTHRNDLINFNFCRITKTRSSSVKNAIVLGFPFYS